MLRDEGQGYLWENLPALTSVRAVKFLSRREAPSTA